MHMFLFLHLLITSDLLFSMLLSSCRAIASFSSRNRRHHLELWLYVLWVPKISQDMFEVLLADMIVQYSYDSSVSVWYLMLLNFFLWFVYLSLNAVSPRMFYWTGLSRSTYVVIQALLLMVAFRFLTLFSAIYDSKEIVQFKYQT